MTTKTKNPIEEVLYRIPRKEMSPHCRQNLRKILTAYLQGKPPKDVQNGLGISRHHARLVYERFKGAQNAS